MTSPLDLRFEIIDSHTRHHKQYKHLHNLLFKNTAMSSEWHYWYHNKIREVSHISYETRTYGVFDKNLLIGIWSVEPKDFNDITGKIIKVGRCFSVGIHPHYRRRGLFVSLSKHAIEQERKATQYEYILGFPQIGRPVTAGHLKTGWEIVQDIEIFSLNPETIENFMPRSKVQMILDFKPLRSFDDLSGSFKNSPAYRNLRWLEHPDNQYIFFSHQNSYIVMKPYGSICHILDLQGKSQSISILLEAAKTLSKRHRWQELNIWCAKNEHYRQEIVNAGFKEGSSYSPSVVLIVVKINAKTPLNLKSGSHFQMGVEEIY